MSNMIVDKLFDVLHNLSVSTMGIDGHRIDSRFVIFVDSCGLREEYEWYLASIINSKSSPSAECFDLPPTGL